MRNVPISLGGEAEFREHRARRLAAVDPPRRARALHLVHVDGAGADVDRRHDASVEYEVRHQARAFGTFRDGNANQKVSVVTGAVLEQRGAYTVLVRIES